MSNEKREYNNTISLKQRDFADILEKAEQSNCQYFMQLHLQGSGIWIESIYPFESGLDRLHALYYKLRSRKGTTVYLCLGLWRKNPSRTALYNALLSINSSVDAVISSDEIADFINMGENECLTLRHPTWRFAQKAVAPFMEYE